MPPGLVTAGMATAIPTTAIPATFTRLATTSISRTPSIPTTSGATGTLAGGTTAITTDLRYRGFPAHLGNPGFPHGRGWPLLAARENAQRFLPTSLACWACWACWAARSAGEGGNESKPPFTGRITPARKLATTSNGITPFTMLTSGERNLGPLLRSDQSRTV